MRPEQWSAIKEILSEALERPKAERPSYLDRVCGDNVDLRRRVESLIEADGRSWSLMDAPAAAASSLAATLRPPASGERIGVYEILEEIGHGGMGSVYLARRADEQFEQRVAIKLSRLSLADDPMQRRFRAERQIVAALDHPNSARLLDGGATSDGRPYFVMEYVAGRPLPDWCEERALTIRQRVQIFLDVCGAVQYAHQRLVVHRDIKPANILVTAEGMAKLLDFGIAKLTVPELFGAAVEETKTLFQLLTPDYASPEQVRGEPVTPASDVYALGVVLYELLTGRRPYKVSTTSPAEMVRVVCETEAPRPSTVAPRSLAKELSGDLDTIVSKALRKEPERRYATAGELAEDLRRFLDGLPVQARPDTAGYRLRKFVKRNRAGVIAASVASLSLVAGGIALWLSFDARRENRVAAVRSAASPAVSSKTLAVLPFKPLVGADQDAVLELGMADTLITKLSSVPGISVRPTGAVLAYSGQRTDAVRAGRELHADAVVEGSLQRLNDRIRVSVQLVSVADGRAIWGETFDTVYTDVFAVQDAIAQQVAVALMPHLSPEARARLARRGTEDLGAYQAYLKGRYFWNRRTESDFRKAIGYFTQAIAADESYSLAHAGLADCYSLLGIWGAGPPRETFGQARIAALRAVAIEDAPGEAHASAALVRWVYDWDWSGAEQGFRRAIALSPNCATAYQWYAYYLAARGRFDESVTQIRRAQELDPLSVSVATDLGEIHCWAGRYDEAIAHVRKALEMEPNFALAHNVLGMANLKSGRVAEGLVELEKAFQLDASPRMLSTLGYGYAIANRAGEARAMGRRLAALSRKRYVSPFAVALIHVGLKEDDRAFALLDRAFDERSDTMAILRVYPLIESLRRDQRFANLIERVDAQAAKDIPARSLQHGGESSASVGAGRG